MSGAVVLVPRPDGFSPPIGVTILALLACLGEAAVVWLALGRMVGEAAILHALICLPPIATFILLRGRAGRLPAAFLAGLTVFCGPFGAFGFVLTAIAHMRFRRDATPFDEWYAALFPDERHDGLKMLFERLATGGNVDRQAESVASFADIMRLGSRDQKEAAITLMARNFKPVFAPALKLALRDPTPAIRVQAATAVAEIENGFTETSMTLKSALDKRADDHAARVALARHYEDYAGCGLLDEDRARDTRRLALDLYLEGARARPGDTGLFSAIGRNLMRLGEEAQAADWLARIIDMGDPAPQLLSWYAECLFRLGRFEDLRALGERHGETLTHSPLLSEGLRQAMALWTDRTPAREPAA